LTQALVAELQRGAPTGPPNAPQIVEEENRRHMMHVTVIWDEWRDIAPEQRGKIIMDAYEQAQRDDLLRITVAMGLTHEEAERLGVTA
jgi:hypothetical protein